MPRGLTTLLLALLAMPALAQSTAPVLAAPPNVNYPPIAKAAHISGDVTITFAINPDGTTTSVQLVSGPPMLAGAVVEPIKKWHFKTPLPLNAQTYFEAKYAFRIKTEDEDDDEDNLDNPPKLINGADVVIPSVTVTGDVQSLDGSQTIDVTPASAVKAADRCPKDANKQAPDKTDLSDYVELLRLGCYNTCAEYRVRVYRNGRVSWRGFSGVTAKGDNEALVGSSSAEELLNNFQTDSFWATCSVQPVPDPKPKPIQPAKPVSDNDDKSTPAEDEEHPTGVFLTASIGGLAKTIDDKELSTTLAWRIDRAADTHRWRHVDPLSEPYANMFEDIDTPKPGTTLLIRATYPFRSKAQHPYTLLAKLLKQGDPVDDADASGWTPLMYASYFHYHHSDSPEDDPVGLLLDAHADPNRASLHGDTALMFAAYGSALLQALLTHGANLNAHNADGLTTLMLLSQFPNHPETLKAALAAGADPNAHDNLGRTALDYLRSASCGHAIIPGPKFESEPDISITVVPSPAVPDPSLCSSNTPGFLESQSLLQAAMKASANP